MQDGVGDLLLRNDTQGDGVSEGVPGCPDVGVRTPMLVSRTKLEQVLQIRFQESVLKHLHAVL